MSVTRLALSLGVVLGAVTAAPAAAQAHGGQGGHGAGHAAGHAAAQPAAAAGWTGDLPKHFEGIALTDSQRTRVVALMHEHHARMDRLRDSARAAGAPITGNAALDARIDAVRTAEHAAFKALLDEAGRRRFDENMARMHGAGHGAPAAGKAAASDTAHGAGHAAHGRPPRR